MTKNKLLWVPSRSMGKISEFTSKLISKANSWIKPVKKLFNSSNTDVSSPVSKKSSLVSKFPKLFTKGSKKNVSSSLIYNPIATPLSTHHINKGKSKGKGKAGDQTILPDNDFTIYQETIKASISTSFDNINDSVGTSSKLLSLPSPSYKHHNQIDSIHALTNVMDNTLPKPMIKFQGIYIENVNVVTDTSIVNNEFFTNISGLKTLEDGFRARFKEDIVFRDKFTKFCLIEHTKFIYYILQIKYDANITDSLAYDKQVIAGILKCFNLIKDYNDIDKDKDLKDFYMYHYPSFMQHMLNCFGRKYTIRPSDFKTIINNTSADFSLFNKLKISNIIEYFITNQNYNLVKFSQEVTFVDSEHPMFDQRSDTPIQKAQANVDRKALNINELKSMEQTGQNRSDLAIKNIIFDKEGYKIEVIYRDVKTYYKNAYSGHVTLKPYLFSNKGVADNYMNNYTKLLVEEMKKNPNADIKRDYTELFNIKQDMKNNIKSVKESVIEFNKILVKISINPLYIELKINITIASDIDADHDFATNILPNLEKAIEEHIKSDNNIFDIDIFFPKNNKIPKLEYQKRMFKLIDTLIPEILRKDFTIEYKKFIKYYDDIK